MFIKIQNDFVNLETVCEIEKDALVPEIYITFTNGKKKEFCFPYDIEKCNTTYNQIMNALDISAEETSEEKCFYCTDPRKINDLKKAGNIVCPECKRTLSEEKGSICEKIRRAVDLKLEVEKEIRWGGTWVRAARNWIQQSVYGGDRVNWGSDDKVTLTMKQLEALSKEVAIEVLCDERNKNKDGA